MYKLFWGSLFLYILFIYISISIMGWDMFFVGGSSGFSRW